MNRMNNITIGCLNIVSHPHSPDLYVELFRDATGLDSVRIGEHQFCRIRHLHPIEGDDLVNGFKGKIIKHLKLSADDQWLNESTDEAADPDDVKDILPDGLMPGMVQFDFVFYPEGHRLFFAMKSEMNTRTRKRSNLGHRTAEKILNNVLLMVSEKRREARKTNLEVRVHIETSNQGIKNILGMKKINILEYEVELPNPDVSESAEKNFKKRLESQKITKQHTKLQAAKGESIVPDDLTKVELEVASSNGYVTGSGVGQDDKRTKISTKEYPFEEPQKYDPVVGIASMLIAKAPDMLNSILARFK